MLLINCEYEVVSVVDRPMTTWEAIADREKRFKQYAEQRRNRMWKDMKDQFQHGQFFYQAQTGRAEDPNSAAQRQADATNAMRRAARTSTDPGGPSWTAYGKWPNKKV